MSLYISSSVRCRIASASVLDLMLQAQSHNLGHCCIVGEKVFLSRYFLKDRSYFRLTVHAPFGRTWRRVCGVVLYCASGV